MKFTINIGELVDALNHVTATLDRKSNLVTSSAYMKAQVKDDKGFLYLYTNNSVAETLIKVPAEVSEEGKTLVQPSLIISGLAGRPKEDKIEVSLLESRLKIQYKKNRFHVAVRGEAEQLETLIKRMPLTKEAAYKVKGSDFIEFVRRGLFCIPSDDNGQSAQLIGGMYFTGNGEGYEAQATDGSIAAQIKIKGTKSKSEMPSFMIPLHALNPVSRLLSRHRGEEIEIVPGATGSHGISAMYFRFGDAMIGSRLLHGQFPALKQVIDGASSEFTFEVDRKEIKEALSRANAFADRTHGQPLLKLNLTKEQVELKTASFGNTDDYVDNVGITVEGSFNPVKLGVGLDYMNNIVNGSTAEKIKIGMKGSVSPIVVSDESDERVTSKYVLMPIRMK